ncbi:hypothetical protein [Streptomyces sp. NPDC004250]|uniref:hypothetical protein n=1 Tax=Streptomyces sp. NPDC004250 TaxID=3364692 RepID=UPI00367B0ECA
MHRAHGTGSRRQGLVRRLAAAAALASLCLLTACDSGGGDGEAADDTGVVSVTGGDKQQEEAAQVERPLIRPDTSDEEKDRLEQVYLDCLAQQDLRMVTNKGGEYEGTYKGIDTRVEKDQAKIADARKKCAAKEPETLPQRSAREDPEYHKKFDKWLDCMRSHGMKVEASPDNPGTFGFPEGLPPADKQRWVEKCESEAFVAK